MEHKHEVTDQDRCFYIDPVKDMAVICEGTVKGLKRGDHGAEVYRFRMPLVIEGHDMSLCNKVEIHYNNIHKDPSTREITVNKSFAEAEGFGADQEDGDTVTWTWKPTGDATQLDGKLAFCIRFACMEGETITYQKFSGIFDAIPVGGTIHNTEALAREYADVLESWRQEIMAQMVTEERVREIAQSQTAQLLDRRETELFPEAELPVDSGETLLAGVILREGRTYRYRINGTEYTDTARSVELEGSQFVYVGDIGLIDGEPEEDAHLLGYMSDVCVLVMPSMGDRVTVSVTEVAETIRPHYLPGACLPLVEIRSSLKSGTVLAENEQAALTEAAAHMMPAVIHVRNTELEFCAVYAFSPVGDGVMYVAHIADGIESQIVKMDGVWTVL